MCDVQASHLSRDKIEFYRNPVTLPAENLTFDAYKTNLHRFKIYNLFSYCKVFRWIEGLSDALE